MPNVIIVVAESSRAKLYKTGLSLESLDELADLTHPESRLHERQITSDLPGSRASTGSGSHHSVDDQTSAKEEEAILFAQTIADRLEEERTAGGLDKLVLIAPPHFLGLLRKGMNSNLAKLVSHELDKNLLHADAETLRRHLPKRL